MSSGLLNCHKTFVASCCSDQCQGVTTELVSLGWEDITELTCIVQTGTLTMGKESVKLH